jgi:hypothetical protein
MFTKNPIQRRIMCAHHAQRHLFQGAAINTILGNTSDHEDTHQATSSAGASKAWIIRLDKLWISDDSSITS